MQISEMLETFRKNFYSVQVNVEDTYMTYRVGAGKAASAANRANDLIKELGLPLIAKVSSLIKNDCFIVRPKINQQ